MGMKHSTCRDKVDNLQGENFNPLHNGIQADSSLDLLMVKNASSPELIAIALGKHSLASPVFSAAYCNCVQRSPQLVFRLKAPCTLTEFG